MNLNIKKTFFLLLVLALLLILIACDSGQGIGASDTSSATPEQSEVSDSEPVESRVQVADTETPWYIEAWETAEAIVLPEVPETGKTLALKVPLHYETSAYEMEHLYNNIKVEVDFYQEYYVAGSAIQAKITITNQHPLETVPVEYEGFGGGFFRKCDASGDQVGGLVGWKRSLLPYRHDTEQPYYTQSYTDNVKTLWLESGESVTFEAVYLPEGDFLDASCQYTFHVIMRDRSSADGGFTYASIEIPLEVVEVDLVGTE